MVFFLKFYFYDFVWMVVVELLLFFLECVKIKGDGYFCQMWVYMCLEVLKVMSVELELEVQILIMDVLVWCIEILGVGCMIVDYFIELGIILYDIIDIYKNRQIERQCEYYLNYFEVIIIVSLFVFSFFVFSIWLVWFIGKFFLWFSCWSI